MRPRMQARWVGVFGGTGLCAHEGCAIMKAVVTTARMGCRVTSRRTSHETRWHADR
jgi:hypothetical protein